MKNLFCLIVAISLSMNVFAEKDTGPYSDLDGMAPKIANAIIDAMKANMKRKGKGEFDAQLQTIGDQEFLLWIKNLDKNMPDDMIRMKYTLKGGGKEMKGRLIIAAYGNKTGAFKAVELSSYGKGRYSSRIGKVAIFSDLPKSHSEKHHLQFIQMIAELLQQKDYEYLIH